MNKKHHFSVISGDAIKTIKLDPDTYRMASGSPWLVAIGVAFILAAVGLAWVAL